MRVFSSFTERHTSVILSTDVSLSTSQVFVRPRFTTATEGRTAVPALGAASTAAGTSDASRETSATSVSARRDEQDMQTPFSEPQGGGCLGPPPCNGEAPCLQVQYSLEEVRVVLRVALDHPVAHRPPQPEGDDRKDHEQGRVQQREREPDDRDGGVRAPPHQPVLLHALDDVHALVVVGISGRARREYAPAVEVPARTTARVRVTRVPGGDAGDLIAVEEPLELRIAGEPIAVTMRTPGHDEELALGFALSEGLRPLGAGPTDDLAANTIELDAPGFDPDRLRRSFYTTSSCGVCGKGALEAVAVEAPRVESDLRVDAAVVESLPARLRGEQATFAATGGLHASGLFTAEGEFISSFGRRGADLGEFNSPVAVVELATGSFAVADLGNDRVQILNFVPRL